MARSGVARQGTLCATDALRANTKIQEDIDDLLPPSSDPVANHKNGPNDKGKHNRRK